MPARTTQLVNNEFYHVYSRGNSKQTIFHDKQDHEHFIHLVDIMNTESRLKTKYNTKIPSEDDHLISIGAFCLMPNHFHMLVKQQKEKGLTLFMQKVTTAYVMYYNKKYERTGALFEGRFKSKYAGEDRYLKYLFSYIHLNPLKILDQNWKTNPIKKEKYTFLLEYPYSSFREYHNGEYVHTNKRHFPDYFPNKVDFMRDVISWLYLEH